MHDQIATQEPCAARRVLPKRRRELGVRLVLGLTALMMVLEVVVGYATHSMALLADGWHMATHVGALGLASAAYSLARRFAAHRAFAFGTGKVQALAGFASAVALGLVALAMIVESLQRLVKPHIIDFVGSLPVAVLGLAVNVLSVFLLHDDHHADEHEHEHEHEHDHNHRAAFMHVVADTLTSGLAILALLTGRYFGASWLDAVSGVVGGVVIVKWAVDLSRSAASELLDLVPSSSLEDGVRRALEALDDVKVRDLHVWSLGAGARSCVVSLVTGAPRAVEDYRHAVAHLGLAHLTIEVVRCPHGHAEAGVA